MVFSSKKKARLAKAPWGGSPEHPTSDAAWSSDGTSLAVVGRAQIYNSDSNVMCFGYDIAGSNNFNENLICQPCLYPGPGFYERTLVWSVKARPQQIVPAATGFDVVSRHGVQTFDFVRPTEEELPGLRQDAMRMARFHSINFACGGANTSAKAAASLADQVMVHPKPRNVLPPAATDPIHKNGFRDYARLILPDPSDGRSCLYSAWITVDNIYVETTRGGNRMPVVTIPLDVHNGIDQPKLSWSPDGKFLSFMRKGFSLVYRPKTLVIYGLDENGWSRKRTLDKVEAACWGPTGFEGQISVIYEDGRVNLERTDGTSDPELLHNLDEEFNGLEKNGKIVWTTPTALEGGQPSPVSYIAVASNKTMAVFAYGSDDSQQQTGGGLTTTTVAEPVTQRMPASEGERASKRAKA